MCLSDWMYTGGIISLLFTCLDAAQLFAQENYLPWPHAAYKCLDNKIGSLVNLDLAPINGAEWDSVITINNEDSYWTGGYYSNIDFYWKFGCYDLNDILSYGLYGTQSVHLVVPNSLPKCVEKCLGDYSAKYVGLMGINCYCITDDIKTLRRYTSNCSVVCSGGINDNCGADGHVSVYEMLDQSQINSTISSLKPSVGHCVAVRKVSGKLNWEVATCSDSKSSICARVSNSTTDKKYTSNTKLLPWREASAECMKEGMNLAKITTADSAVASSLPDDTPFWIGLYRGRNFRWIKGDAPVSEVDSCVVVRRKSKSSPLERVEEACDQMLKFVCQKFDDAPAVESAVVGTPKPTTVQTTTSIEPTTTEGRRTTAEQTTAVPTTTIALPTTENIMTDNPTSTLSQTTDEQTTEIKETTTQHVTTPQLTTSEITTLLQVTTSDITTLETTTTKITTSETITYITTQEVTTDNTTPEVTKHITTLENTTPQSTTDIISTSIVTTENMTTVENTIDLVEGSKDIVVIELLGETEPDDNSVEAAVARQDASSESSNTKGTKTELVVILVLLMTVFLIVCIIVIVMLVRYRRSHRNQGYTMRPHRTEIHFEGQEDLFIKEYRRSAEQANPSPKPVPRIDVDGDESLEKVLVTIEPQNSYQRYQSNETLDIPWIDGSRNTLDNISEKGSLQTFKKDEHTSLSAPDLDKVGADSTGNSSGQKVQVVSTDL